MQPTNLWKRVKGAVSSASLQTKATVAGGATLAVNSVANAAVSYDAATGFTGSIDSLPLTSAVVVGLTLTGIALAVYAGIKGLKKSAA